MNSQSILPASCTSSCLMLMIWSSRARNRSADPVVSCFFGRIAPSDAATESCFSIRGNRENEIASFQGLRHGNLAISSQQSRQKKTLAQWVRNSSRATIYDGATRTEAAKIGGVGLQIIRDWVLRFNARGPDGLLDGKSTGQPSKLNDTQRQAIAGMIESGPIPAVHGVVRWRLIDLAQWIFEEFRITIAKQTLSRELRAMGYRKLSA